MSSPNYCIDSPMYFDTYIYSPATVGTPVQSNAAQLCHKFYFIQLYTFSAFVGIVRNVIILLCLLL